jgi:hypothetical protein
MIRKMSIIFCSIHLYSGNSCIKEHSFAYTVSTLPGEEPTNEYGITALIHGPTPH